MLTIEEIKEILFNAYDIENGDDYNAECGCYVGGKWLSVNDILELLEKNA